MTEPLKIWISVIISIALLTYGISNQSAIAYIGFGLLLGSAVYSVKFRKEGE